MEGVGHPVISVNADVCDYPEILCCILQEIPDHIVTDGSFQEWIWLVNLDGAAIISVQAVPGAKPDVIMPVHIYGCDGTIRQFGKLVYMLIGPG